MKKRSRLQQKRRPQSGLLLGLLLGLPEAGLPAASPGQTKKRLSLQPAAEPLQEMPQHGPTAPTDAEQQLPLQPPPKKESAPGAFGGEQQVLSCRHLRKVAALLETGAKFFLQRLLQDKQQQQTAPHHQRHQQQPAQHHQHHHLLLQLLLGAGLVLLGLKKR
jgi:hypothetical protein